MNEIRTFFRAIGSLWFAAVILVLLMIAMGSATVFEKMYGTDHALASFYRAWWFRGLLALGALNIFAAMVARFPWRPGQIGFLMTHAGMLVILLGALVSQRSGVDGRVGIDEGETLTRLLDLHRSSLTITNRAEGTEAVIDLTHTVGGFEVIEHPKTKRARAGDDISFEVVRYYPDAVWKRPAAKDGVEQEPQIELCTPVRKTRQPAILVRATVGDVTKETWIPMGRARSLRVRDKVFQFAYGMRQAPLGFSVRLDRFHIEYYPGSMRPRSFESYVTLRDPKDGLAVQRKISMNHPTSFGGYTFYQSSYQLAAGGRGPATSYLSVSNDPGKPLAFAGFFLTIVGMFIVLGQRMRDPRRMGKVTAGAMVAAAVAVLGTAPAMAQDAPPAAKQEAPAAKPEAPAAKPEAPAAKQEAPAANPEAPGAKPEAAADVTAEPRLPDGLDMSVLRGIVVQHDGRWMPFDTMARHSVWGVTGKESYRDRDPVTVLLSWTFDAKRWERTPVIVIHSAEARQVIGLDPDRTAFSFTELALHRGLRTLFEKSRDRDPDKKPDPLESLVDKIHGKMMDLQNIYDGARIRLIPHPNQAKGKWFSAQWLVARGAGVEQMKPVREAWEALQAAFLNGAPAEFRQASDALASALAATPAAYRPPASIIETELRYNDLAPFRWAWIIMAIGFGAALVGLAVRQKLWDGVVALILIAGVVVGIYGLSLRGALAGEIPATNMYESLLFLGLGVGAFAVVAMPVFRGRFIPLIACFLGALSLCLTDVLPLNYFVRPIVPVLRDTYWMTIHVPVIMVSYAVLFLGVLVAHVLVVTMATVPKKSVFIETLDRIHYWFIHVGSILLFIGIVTGSMWGADAWGRYWGWDPKEVWSLVAFLGYMAIMHLRVNREAIPAWAYGVALLLGGGTLALVVPQLSTTGSLVGVWFAGVSVAALFFLLASGRAAVAVKSILAFWLIIMTYIGVNYVLGVGLHSYGFGTGAVRNWAFAIGGIDLGIMLLFYVVHLVRRGSESLKSESLESGTA